MSSNIFGQFFKKKRIKLGMTLRQFCMENNLDPGNISKIERGILPPPTNSEKLGQYAKFLDIKEGSNDWYEFFDLAYASSGRIPEEIVSNKDLVSKLPLVFRTLRGQKLTKDQLEKLAEKLKEI
ncbi:MAG: helix-turn-helix domain-containing protein [Proteobacteria bacterium]|nr:helix-turn-helix domain-containing protein [Pseudomonadota bacterium]